jgi:hypothetical protein
MQVSVLLYTKLLWLDQEVGAPGNVLLHTEKHYGLTKRNLVPCAPKP